MTRGGAAHLGYSASMPNVLQTVMSTLCTVCLPFVLNVDEHTSSPLSNSTVIRQVSLGLTGVRDLWPRPVNVAVGAAS